MRQHPVVTNGKTLDLKSIGYLKDEEAVLGTVLHHNGEDSVYFDVKLYPEADNVVLEVKQSDCTPGIISYRHHLKDDHLTSAYVDQFGETNRDAWFEILDTLLHQLYQHCPDGLCQLKH